MLKHFEEELKILEKQVDPTEEDGDLIIRDYIPQIREILKIAETQGHSGGSVQYYAATIANTIKNALLHKPLSPLNGGDDEWVIHDYDETLYAQNIRNTAVFKDKDGKCCFIDAVVFQGEEEHDIFTGSVEDIKSRQFIKSFPFTPKTFYIDVYKELYDKEKHGQNVVISSCRADGYCYFIKDRKQLDEVWEYYEQPKII